MSLRGMVENWADKNRLAEVEVVAHPIRAAYNRAVDIYNAALDHNTVLRNQLRALQDEEEIWNRYITGAASRAVAIMRVKPIPENHLLNMPHEVSPLSKAQRFLLSGLIARHVDRALSRVEHESNGNLLDNQTRQNLARRMVIPETQRNAAEAWVQGHGVKAIEKAFVSNAVSALPMQRVADPNSIEDDVLQRIAEKLNLPARAVSAL